MDNQNKTMKTPCCDCIATERGQSINFNFSTLTPEDALEKLEKLRSKIAFMADAVTSWPAKACDPDEDEIMGAVFTFKDITRQIDEIGEVFAAHLNKNDRNQPRQSGGCKRSPCQGLNNREQRKQEK
jgi:hypothetical protein